jgi:ribosomal protein L32
MRHTSSHSKNRRSHHALENTTIVIDKESKALRLPHRLDESTGMYKGIQIVAKKTLKKEEIKEKKSAKKHDHEHVEGVNTPIHAEKHLAEEKSEKKSQGVLGRITTGRGLNNRARTTKGT